MVSQILWPGPTHWVTACSGLSGNMIYHRYVITSQLWYNNQSNYRSSLIYHIRYHPLFFGLRRGLLSAPPALRRPQHSLTHGKSRLRPTAHPFPKRHNSLAPAIPHWGVACHYPPFSGCSIPHVICNLSDSIVYHHIPYPIPPHFPPLACFILFFSGLHFGHN